MAEVVLHPGRDRSLRRRHPWLLSGAVARVEGAAAAGEAVAVRSAEGELLGFGHLAPRSQIRVRMLSFGKEPPPEDWIARRVARAVAWRRGHPALAGTDAVRLVNAEGDGLPGLVADRYGEVVVARLSAAGMVARREEVARALREATGAPFGYARDDAAALRREGLPTQEGPLWGGAPPAPLRVREDGRRHRVDVVHGQKTGFYLDQRDARRLVARLAAGRRMLDLFAFTGGFAVAAAAGGASAVTLVESSRDARALAARDLEDLAADAAVRIVDGDAFRFVREDDGLYDLLVLDPPPLARRRADVPRATRAYKDLLLHALRRAAPGAELLAFACSHHVGPELFRKVAFAASLDAARPVQVLGELGAPVDHPVALDHPEGRYLTGLWLRAPE